MTLLRSIACIAVIALSQSGCAGLDPSDDDAAEVADADKADDVSRPLGTYRSFAADSFGWLVLRADRTFTRVVYAGSTSSTERGTYRFTSSGPRRYIRFDGHDDADLGRYAYVLDAGGVLQLRKTYTTEWFEMQAYEDAWCEAAPECSLQGLAPRACDGAWSCASYNRCEYQYDCSAASDEDFIRGLADSLGEYLDYEATAWEPHLVALAGALPAPVRAATDARVTSFGDASIDDRVLAIVRDGTTIGYVVVIAKDDEDNGLRLFVTPFGSVIVEVAWTA